MIVSSVGLPTIYHIFAHAIPVEERSRAFGYLVAMGSIGQTVSAVVSRHIEIVMIQCYSRAKQRNQ